jgi:integrase
MSVKLRFKTLKDGRKSFYLDIYHNNQRYYEFLKIHIGKGDTAKNKKEKKQLVESIRATKELELQNEEYGFTPKHKKNIDFLKYYQNFLDNYKGKDHRLVRYSLEKFKTMTQTKKLPSKNVTPKLCQEFADFLKNPENGLKGETPYNYWTKFRKVLKEAVNEGIFKKNPSEGIVVKRKTGQLKKNVLTKDELQLLAKTHCVNEEVKRAFLFACFTGLGMAEIRKLTWARVVNKKLKIYREKTKEQMINDLHPVALKLLGEKGKPNEKIFTLPSDVAISKDLKKWVKLAGIEKNISFYCGRHTFATQLLLNGANLKTVADCLGHSNTRHTIKYLYYVDELKSEAISNLPNIDF